MAYDGPEPLAVAAGGTGKNSFTAYAVICGGTDFNNPLQNTVTAGTAGQVLVSGGTSALPSWADVGTGTVNSLMGNDSNIVSGTAASVYNVNLLGDTGVHVTGNPGTSTVTITVDGVTPITVTTDSGTATQTGGNLNFLSGSSVTTDVTSGLETDGATDTVTIRLTNRVVASSTTTGTTPSSVTLMTGLASNTNYSYTINVGGYDSADGKGCNIYLVGCVKNVSGTLSVCGTPSQTFTGDATLSGATATLDVSGSNVQITFTGVTGKTIAWNSIGTYTSSS